jgi:hypothetical protein
MTKNSADMAIKNSIDSRLNSMFLDGGLTYRDIDMEAFLKLNWDLKDAFSDENLKKKTLKNGLRLSNKSVFLGSAKGGLTEGKIYFSNEEKINSRLIFFNKGGWIQLGNQLSLREMGIVSESFSAWVDWMKSFRRGA